MKTAIDNFSIEPPKKLPFRERVCLYAHQKLGEALIARKSLSAAFWMGLLQAVQEDSLKN